ncbi:MAG: ABC transporter permease [Solirubrobacterales bacterium]|nr:ABC transporter permease [Solirubrobacterales bacterium]
MARFIVRRLIASVFLLIVVSAVVFLLFYVFPSADPAQLRAGRQANADQIQAIRESLGLDKSVIAQFWIYIKGVFTPLDLPGTDSHGPLYFGHSYQSNADVKDVIFSDLPATVMLVVGAVIVWMGVAIPTGIISAVRRRSFLDRATMITTLIFISAPVFWLGLVFLYLFADDVGLIPIFPGIGSYGAADTFAGKVGAMILPWLVLGLATAAIYARYLRSQMLDVMEEDYIRTAYAKGLPDKRVIMKHTLRSAITPIVTLLGLDVAVLLAGNAILTETVFNIPGVGAETFNAIKRSDLPMIQGITLFGAFFIVTLNLVVDIAYAYLDPRVRYD